MSELKLSDKYMLTIKEAGAYFNIGEKKMRRMAEDNHGSFAIYFGNRYLILRAMMEAYFRELAERKEEQDAESDSGE